MGQLILLFLLHTANADCLKVPYSPKLVSKVATKYGLEPKMLIALVELESSGNQYAYNKKTKDYGLLQVNQIHLGKGENPLCLMRDARLNLERGTKILVYMQKRYASRERDWMCRYNLGTRTLIGARYDLCVKYIRRYNAIRYGRELMVAEQR